MSSLVEPTKPASSVSSVLGGRAEARDELVRDALFLDFAGYHVGARNVLRVLRARRPGDPEAALIEVEHRFWLQIYDVGPIRDDPGLIHAIESALALAKAGHEADPNDLEARALYGRALIHDARRLALDGYLIKAGSQGESARKHLEIVVRSRPEDHDSSYLLGNYYYWAGVLPAYLKYVNWLWFVPQGDTGEGVALLRDASRNDGNYAESAQVMLSVISSHHVPADFEDAHTRLTRLHRIYPKNVLIHHELVDVLFKMKRWDELGGALDRLAARANEPQPVRAYGLVADLWRARVALHQRHVDEAESRLDKVTQSGDELPNWSHAWMDVMRGQIEDLRGRRAAARKLYERAIEREGVEKSPRADRMARQGLEVPFDPDRFEPPLLATDRD